MQKLTLLEQAAKILFNDSVSFDFKKTGKNIFGNNYVKLWYITYEEKYSFLFVLLMFFTLGFAKSILFSSFKTIPTKIIERRRTITLTDIGGKIKITGNFDGVDTAYFQLNEKIPDLISHNTGIVGIKNFIEKFKEFFKKNWILIFIVLFFCSAIISGMLEALQK